MMKKGIFMSTLSLAAILAACDCCPQGEAKALSQDKELRAVMDNFTQNEVPAATPLVEKREVELIRLVSLVTQQSGALLQEEVATALAQGLSPEEILEAIYQCAPYTGFPRTVDAVEIARSVFKAKNVKVDENRRTVTAQSRLEAGADAQGTLFGETFPDMAKNGKDGMPIINYFLASNCFGDYYTRKGLDLNTRELLTMAILVNLGTEPQLKAHIGANLKIRTAEYVEQAIYNCLPYCGYPRTLNALRLLKEAAAEAKTATVAKTMPGKDWSVFPVGKPNDAYAKYFVGKSYLDMISTEQVGVGNVTFEPACRNNWHIHHAKKGGGQILIATAGRGYYQEWGKPAVELKPGDVVNIPAGVKHWHGAAPDSWFQHLAIEVPGEGTSNEWLEPVSDEEYARLK
ncbi:quercetin dioxygenase-like cupin family protein [Hallerella succinigenes]|uniref:Quercetin dioxygenase-like cupin family protein n=2 Tax=Hallerella succinigenes TaxID=1896222 RepID=A0A2M9A526_9BACT|nr:carboxymuconolactone decarboxylase family protein [Hallerella succinigenes]PJJ40821.1 quercetin dioxygenase-like cupin family protein [Hallerella succinigenes]